MSPYLSNLAPEEYLEGNRRRLYSAIYDRPGVCFTDLRDEIGAGLGTVQYHLETLERLGVVESVKVGRFRRYYPVGHDDSGSLEVHGHAADPGYARVMRVLDWFPGSSMKELEDVFEDVTRQTISYRLGRLESVGAVAAEKRGRKTRYRLNEEAKKALSQADMVRSTTSHCDFPQILPAYG